MAETIGTLPRNEIFFIAMDPTGGTAVQTLVESASGIMRHDDYEWWLRADKASELLIELENAVYILRRRCDHLCERELAF